jgi:hypothetical protein
MAPTVAAPRTGRMALQAGYHPIEVQYFEDYDGQTLRIEWEGPGIPLQHLDMQHLWHLSE